MLTEQIARLWRWVTGQSAKSDGAYWRIPTGGQNWDQYKQGTVKKEEAPANNEPEPLPIGSRFRPPVSDFSPTVGQLEEMNRLVSTVRPLPQGAMRVMQELDSNSASAASVAKAIECEPVIAASVVRVSNSSAFGLSREITSVSEAVSYLGFSTTKSLLLRYNIGGLLPNARGGQGYDTSKLWIHGMTVAQVAEEIARRSGRATPSLSLTSGLLHDIGKLVINGQFNNVGELWAPAADVKEGMLDRERRLFGADHAILGATLATEWKLPNDLVEIIRHHHSNEAQTAELPVEVRRVLFCVQIANQLVKMRHFYCEGMEIDPITESMTADLGLPSFTELMFDAKLRFMIERIVGMNGGTMAGMNVAA